MRNCCPAILALAPVLALAGASPASPQRLPLSLGGVRATTAVQSLQEIRQACIVRQRWDLSCGSAALSTLLTYDLSDPTPETAVVVWVLHRTDPVRVRSRGGFSLLDLKRFVQFRGYNAEGYADLSLDELAGLGGAAIVPIRIKSYDHFVVFRGVMGGRVILADPAFGNLTMAVERFLKIWKNGIGFVVLPRKPSSAPGQAAARAEKLPFPDVGSIYRGLRAGGLAPLTRRSP